MKVKLTGESWGNQRNDVVEASDETDAAEPGWHKITQRGHMRKSYNVYIGDDHERGGGYAGEVVEAKPKVDPAEVTDDTEFVAVPVFSQVGTQLVKEIPDVLKKFDQKENLVFLGTVDIANDEGYDERRVQLWLGSHLDAGDGVQEKHPGRVITWVYTYNEELGEWDATSAKLDIEFGIVDKPTPS